MYVFPSYSVSVYLIFNLTLECSRENLYTLQDKTVTCLASLFKVIFQESCVFCVELIAFLFNLDTF